jgi:acetyltransferase-like isoleucine patch superfamily enzyme
MKTFKTILGVLHYFGIRLWYLKKFKASALSVFACTASVNIQKGGSLEMAGKVALSAHCQLLAIGKIKLGKNVYINKFSRIIAHSNIEIGNNVLIAQHVAILDHDHKYSYENESIHFNDYTVANVKIGSNVLIGDKVTILKGTSIGDNVIIGANTLVKGNIPSNSRVTTNPGAITQLTITNIK